MQSRGLGLILHYEILRLRIRSAQNGRAGGRRPLDGFTIVQKKYLRLCKDFAKYLSTKRTIFVAAYNGERLADVDFESVSAVNSLYTAELAVEKADYDEVKVFVWETADNVPALPEVFNLGEWLAK